MGHVMEQAKEGRAHIAHIDIVLLFGYAIFLLQSGLIPVSSASPAAFTDTYTQLLNGTMQAGAILALLFSAFYARACGRSTRESLFWLAIILESFGYLLWVLTYNGVGDASAQVLSRLLIGSGFSFVLVLWVDIFSVMPSSQVQLTVLLASFLTSLLAMICLTTLPTEGRELATFVLTPLYLILLSVTNKRWPPHQASGGNALLEQKASSSLPSFSLQQLKMLTVPLVCIALLVTVGPVMAFSVFTQRNGSLVMANAVNIGLALACLILLVYCVKLHHSLSITTLYFAAFPVLATSLVAMSIFGTQFELAFAVISHTVYNLVSLVAIFESIRINRDKKLPVILIYSIFTFVVYFASTIGAWIGDAVGSFFLNSTLVSVISLVLVYCLSLVVVSLYRSELKRRTASEHDKAHETRDPVEDACMLIAQERQLTPREATILDHIAHGRNVPAIAEKMFLSKETIRTHVKGLYRALGVHSRQEVIDLIETYIAKN